MLSKKASMMKRGNDDVAEAEINALDDYHTFSLISFDGGFRLRDFGEGTLKNDFIAMILEKGSKEVLYYAYHEYEET